MLEPFLRSIWHKSLLLGPQHRQIQQRGSGGGACCFIGVREFRKQNNVIKFCLCVHLGSFVLPKNIYKSYKINGSYSISMPIYKCQIPIRYTKHGSKDLKWNIGCALLYDYSSFYDGSSSCVCSAYNTYRYVFAYALDICFLGLSSNYRITIGSDLIRNSGIEI